MRPRQSSVLRLWPILILAFGVALIGPLIPDLCAGRAVSSSLIDAAKSQEGIQEVVRQLASGKILSESLSKNKKVVVTADLGAGQFLHLKVVPSGIQVSAQVIDPLGKMLRKVQRPYSSERPVSVFLAARVRGRRGNGNLRRSESPAWRVYGG